MHRLNSSKTIQEDSTVYSNTPPLLRAIAYLIGSIKSSPCALKQSALSAPSRVSSSKCVYYVNIIRAFNTRTWATNNRHFSDQAIYITISISKRTSWNFLFSFDLHFTFATWAVKFSSPLCKRTACIYVCVHTTPAFNTDKLLIRMIKIDCDVLSERIYFLGIHTR